MNSGNFLNGKSFVADEADCQRKFGSGFHCKLCGHKVVVGDVVRWVYANGIEGQGTGNFFVCASCDGPDVLKRAKESLQLAVKLAKQWGIYGPDWQDQAQFKPD